MRFFSLEVVNLRDTLGRFAKSLDGLQVARRDEMRNYGKAIVKTMREEAPERTGRLKKGITFKTFDRDSKTDLSITSAADYTKYVIHGRGPVVAKNAKALRFEPGHPGTGFIFRKSVGPAKANPFHKRAYQRVIDDGEPLMAIRRISGHITRAWSGF